MLMGEFTVHSSTSPRSDQSFQDLLLKVSSASADGIDPDSLIRSFCRASREFFGVDGVYFWKLASPDELVGVEADGWRAEMFVGLRLKTSQAALGVEAVRGRKTVTANRIDSTRSVLTTSFQLKSAMASPLVVF